MIGLDKHCMVKWSRPHIISIVLFLDRHNNGLFQMDTFYFNTFISVILTLYCCDSHCEHVNVEIFFRCKKQFFSQGGTRDKHVESPNNWHWLMDSSIRLKFESIIIIANLLILMHTQTHTHIESYENVMMIAVKMMQSMDKTWRIFYVCHLLLYFVWIVFNENSQFIRL